MKMEKEKCPQCGTIVEKDTKFCYNCGAKINVTQINPPQIQKNVNSIKSNTKNTKSFCTQCGNQINGNSNYCPKCGNSLNSANPQNAHYNVGMLQESNVIPIRRLALLMILTGGLYTFYWYYKNSTSLKEYYHEDTSPVLFTILLLIPIVNWIIIYELFNQYEKKLKLENIPSYSSGGNLIVWILLPFLQIWVLINIQESLNELWKKEQPELPVRRSFSDVEIMIMIIIPVLLFIIIFMSIIGTINSMINQSYYYDNTYYLLRLLI
jgi:RNA polymerase subunit RPABC4/transcription elongation factor Spt4